MIRLAFALFAFVLTHAAFAAKLKVCEDGLTTPAIRYLRTLRSGVSEGLVSAADLEWTIEQPQPVIPIRDGRDIDNLAHLKKFRTEKSKITDEQWQLIVAQARALLQQVKAGAKQVEEAREHTRKISAMIPVDMNFLPGETIAKTHMTPDGVMYAFTHTRKDTFVHNITHGGKVTLQGRPPTPQHLHDFFETSSGQLLFALVAEGYLKIVNLTTGQDVADINLMGGQYMPLMYEEKGILTIALGERASFEKYALTPSFKIQVLPDGRTTELESFHDLSYHVARLADGHLYGRIIYDLKKFPLAFFVTVKDLTLDKEIFRCEEVPGSFAVGGTDSVMILADGLKMLLSQKRDVWQVLDSASCTLKPIAYAHSAHDASHIFNYRGDAISAKGTFHDGKYQFELMKMPLGQPSYLDLNFAPGNKSTIKYQSVTPSPQGPLVFDWEFTHDLKRTTLHLVNIETKQWVSLSSPPNLRFPHQIYYNHADDRLLMLADLEDGRNAIIQLFGPDRSAP